ncbi:MAG: IS701 family transposase [Actinobacteria bacterium]|nr:IS701 family transposase [Actinomycetota bacterium]
MGEVAVLEPAGEPGAAAVRERLEAFVGQVASGLGRAEQRRGAELYVRGMLEAGSRKSLEPLVARLGGDGDYEALQHFLADSPWDPALVLQATAELVCPQIGVKAWVLDDTGFPKDGKRSPGVKRQYSGTLGKIGNCQLGVSVHAVGERGTLPLGWALYLPEDWCDDPDRRRRAKIPAEVAFKTKPELGVELIERAVGWEILRAPVLGDHAYGENSALRARLDGAGSEYVLSIGPESKAFCAKTVFAVAERRPGKGGTPRVARPDRPPRSLRALADELSPEDFQILTYRDGPDGEPVSSRFAFLRISAAHPVTRDKLPPRQEWLIIEWPPDTEQPSDYWISNLPADADPERLARLARLRWQVELDYRQLKGELGLDHYEGRSYLGWHHHTALVTAAHAFLTLERLDPKAPRPA